VIRALAAVRAEIDPDATLDLVGLAQFVRYAAACRALTRRLGLEDAVRFRGSVSERALRRAYRDSDVFVCLSDHEGFCVPLLEAFAARLPVVAYASSAVTETARDAALLLPMKPPSLVAEAVGEITANARLRAELRVGQGERLADFAPAAVRARFDRFVDEAAA
jgi:glycosyltransferase involved in cell wall biosynthesis